MVCAFIVLLLCGIQLTKGDIVLRWSNGNEFVAASAPYISFPSNQTYDSGLLTLHVNFHSFNVGGINYSMSYSLDGKENETVALTQHYYFSLSHRSPPNYCDGLVALPILSNGSHCLTVYIETIHDRGRYANHTEYYETVFDSQTVYFTVLSPIAFLMEKNKTYNTTEIPLDFIADGAASQVAYSLDFHTNITVSGNITLTGLTEGTHTLIIYANNTWGNATSIDINAFTIAKPSLSQSTSLTFQIQNTFFLILILTIALVAITILLVLRKRKIKQESYVPTSKIQMKT